MPKCGKPKMAGGGMARLPKRDNLLQTPETTARTRLKNAAARGGDEAASARTSLFIDDMVRRDSGGDHKSWTQGDAKLPRRTDKMSKGGIVKKPKRK